MFKQWLAKLLYTCDECHRHKGHDPGCSHSEFNQAMVRLAREKAKQCR